MTTTTMQVMQVPPSLLQEAARVLARRDLDHASQVNDRGYSKADSSFGHALAAWDGEWDSELVADAWAMLAHYKGQLADEGIRIPPPPRTGSGNARSRLRAWKGERELVVASDGQFKLEEPAAPTEPSGSAKAESGAIWLALDHFNAAFVAQVKSVPGATWVSTSHAWRVPAVEVERARQIAEHFGLKVDRSLTDLAPPSLPKWLERDKEGWLVRFPYDGDMVAAIKAIPGRRWLGDQRCWFVPSDQTGKLRAFGERFGLEIPPEFAGARDPQGEADDLRRDLCRASDAEPVEVPGLAGELRPYQHAAVRFATADRRGVLIADDMGLGKTIEALATIVVEGHRRTVVVAPASVKSVWVDSIRRFLPSYDVVAWEHRSGEVVTPTEPGFVVIGYDTLADRLPDLERFDPQAVIFDEIHLAKSPKSQRGKTAAALAKGRRAMGLSGTPMPNRPSDLVQPLKILGRLGELGGWERFVTRYCGACRNAYGWDISGATNLPELRDQLQKVMIVRKKTVVAPELVKLPRQTVPVEPDPGFWQEYQEAEAEVVKYLAERAAELAAEAGDDPRAAASLAVRKALAAEVLVRLTTLRRLIGLAKANGAIEVVRGILEDETGGVDLDTDTVQPPSKVLVFGRHLEVLERIAAELGAPLLTGKTPLSERTAVVQQFQEDPNCRVLVLSTVAGGVGLTLTAANHVVTVEFEWRSIDHDQAEDRACRIGQTRAVLPTYLFVPGTVDEEMAGILAGKAQAVAEVLEGNSSEETGDLALAAVGWLLGRGDGKNS